MSVDGAMRALIRDLIREELRLQTPGDTYSSTSLPPDCPSKRRFAEVARTMPTAAKRGKTWVVPRADWEALRHRPRAADPAGDAIADAYIEAAGFRQTRAS